MYKRLLCVFVILSLSFIAIVPQNAVAEENEESIFLTTVMYHSVVENASGIYKVSPKTFENDLVAFEKNGYTFVSAKELIAYTKGWGYLPEKPLLITFDDGHYNNLYYALPILLKHNATAIINVIGKFSAYASENETKHSPYYSYLTWEEIKTLSDYGIEIGNHTYNMHDFKPRFGIKQKVDETFSEYNHALMDDISRLDEKLLYLTGNQPLVFAYPFGTYNKIAESVLKEMGYKITLTCNEKHTRIRRNHPEDLYLVGRYNRDGRESTASFLQKIK